MGLDDLTPVERRALAKKVKSDPVYLWQCGKGIRTPSPRLAHKLIKADSRLTLEHIYARAGDRKVRRQTKEARAA